MMRVIVLTTLAALVGAGAPIGAHETAVGEFSVIKNDVVQTSYAVGILCADTVCEVEVDTDLDGNPLPMRDLVFFEHWCGANPATLIVPAGTQEKSFTCEGNGPWRIDGRVHFNGATHETSVTVIFKVTAPPHDGGPQ